eukprot:3027839-Prymnesium_polylepis.1
MSACRKRKKTAAAEGAQKKCAVRRTAGTHWRDAQAGAWRRTPRLRPCLSEQPRGLVCLFGFGQRGCSEAHRGQVEWPMVRRKAVLGRHAALYSSIKGSLARTLCTCPRLAGISLQMRQIVAANPVAARPRSAA